MGFNSAFKGLSIIDVFEQPINAYASQSVMCDVCCSLTHLPGFLTVFYSSGSQLVACGPSNDHWLISKKLPPLARVSANSRKLETRLAPAVSAWFLLVYSVIISVMNAV
jgi:hypothetical protein